MTTIIPPGYKPTDSEPFMNEVMKEYFRQKLLLWREDLLRDSGATLSNLQQEGGAQEADLADRATTETDRALELRTRDRERKLIAKIDSALERLIDGSYGYCEESGEQIGVRRLDARPIATLSIEAQERHERLERTYRDEA
jgi:DnaK suppressor protein